MAINTLGFPMPQAFSGGADFSQLANLGNVMQEQQDRTTKLQALRQLGNDPTQNAMILIKSGDPQLAQHGIDLMNTIQQQNRLNAQEAERQRQFQLEYGLNREKFEAEDPDTRQEAWLKGHPGGNVNSPEAQAYIYKQPQLLAENRQTSTDRKAIREADDQVFAAQAGLQSLNHMETLRQQAIHAGPLTEPIGYAASFLPEGYGGTAGKATEELRNEALNQMINRVKASFGGNPSNKEDAWLLEAQASANKSSEVQKDIIGRGKEILQTRLQQNMDRANELRGGTFYKPGGGATALPPAPGGGSTALPQATGQPTTPPNATPTSGAGQPQLRPIPDRLRNRAKAAIAQGKDKNGVRQAIIDGGYDPGDIGQ